MDYKFLRDVSGKPIAQCEEVSTFGDWLTDDLGGNSEKVSALLETISQLQTNQLSTHKLKGQNYTMVLDQDEALLHIHLGYWDEDADLPEGTELDQQSAVGCGLEDLKDLIVAWEEFIGN